MKIQNETLYHKFKTYIQGVCHDSLEWGPGRPQFEAFLNFLQKEEPVVETVRWWKPDADPRAEISSWVLAFSHRYQNALSTLVWNKQVFDQVYDVFEGFIYSHTLRVTYITPIYFFECDSSERIRLDTDVGIARPCDIENIEPVLKAFKEEATYFWTEYEWCIYAHINISKTEPRRDRPVELSASAKIEDVLTSLRLINDALVYVGSLYCTEGSPFAGIHGGHISLLPRQPFGLPLLGYLVLSTYKLDKDRVDNLRQVYRVLSALSRSDRDSLHIPLSRLNVSYMHSDMRDKLIDLCIAMESLYLRETQELAYKLALRAAYFLEHEAERRSHAFQRIKQIYAERGKIVHGTAKKRTALDELTLQQLVDDAEEYLRRSIIKLLSNPDDIRQISKKPKERELHSLDKLILSSGTESHGG